ncbi:MAG: haloacid dehalogenase-like hydrolase [Proteobacteria bacterium]|uniref:HAD family hydrolase n=1 Tax=Rudaea sp. TaxID=2136325 RepID=UPI0032209ACB|nr:haloacid dehalogenase-like hydrolase [Pseudomonadota bacterium]
MDDSRKIAASSVVLFDFDGVLFKGDAFTTFLREHCRRQWWRVALAAPLLLFAAPFALVRKTRRRALRFFVHLALVGIPLPRYRRLARDFGAALACDARRFSRPALETLNAHRHRGARVIVVTGCEETLARAMLDGLGLADIELVASRCEAGRLGPRIKVHNVGFQKAHQLRLRGVRAPWDVAYGDSIADLDMLAGARSAVLVNPDRVLLARLSARLRQRLAIVEW